MASPRNVIHEMFTSVLQHGITAPGSLSSICIYPYAVHQSPQLSLVLRVRSSNALSSGSKVASQKMLLPLRNPTVRQVIGKNHSLAVIPARDLSFGNPTWGPWVARTVLSKVRRDLGLDARGGPGGEVVVELKDLLLIGAGGEIFSEQRYDMGLE